MNRHDLRPPFGRSDRIEIRRHRVYGNLKMKKTERARIVQQRLQTLYPDPPVPLDHHDPFTLLVAVVLSAQCTDKKVNEVTPALFDVAGTPTKMKELGAKRIYPYLKTLGLAKQKAKSLAGLATIIMDEHQGEVPRTFEELEALPGVGHKTASVVMAQAFNVPAFPVDTHIHRLSQRWGLTNGRNVQQTEMDLKKLFPIECWNDLHLQIIFYGREFCTARGCDGTKCDLCRELYPNRRKPVVVKKP